MVTTEDNYFLLHGGPDPPTERETSREVGCWSRIFL